MSNQPGPSKKLKIIEKVNALDPEFEQTYLKWFEEGQSDFSDQDDISEHALELSDHDTVSEFELGGDELENESTIQDDERNVVMSDNSDEGSDLDATKRNYYGKNRFKWSSQTFHSRSRTLRHNIIMQLPGLRPSARLENSANPLEVWRLLFTDDILDTILRWTNVKIEKERIKYTRSSRPELRDMDMIELKAFIGLLFYTAVFVSNHEKIERIFATDGTGREIFRCVMSKNRFTFLLVCLRFDNPEDRHERKKRSCLCHFRNF